MKKQNLILFLILSISILSFQACKTSDETNPPPPSTPHGVFSVIALYGYSIYARDLNLSTMHFTTSINSADNIGGTVTSWQFTIKKDSTTLWTINMNNFSTFLFSAYSTTGSYSIPANQNMTLTVTHDAGVYINGNPFGNVVPNKLEFYVSIKDNNGFTWSGTYSSNFDLTIL